AGLGRDRARKHLRGVELRHVGPGDFRLLVVPRENLGAVLRAGVGALAVHLRWVMRNREEDLQDGAVGDLLGIVGDLHRLGVAGAAGADALVVGILLVAAGVDRHGLGD